MVIIEKACFRIWIDKYSAMLTKYGGGDLVIHSKINVLN